jgi:hypothetical protein
MIKLSRDPALYLTGFATAIRLAAAFGLNFTETQQTILNATATAVAGLIVAVWVRRDGQVAAVLGAIQAVLALAVGFGLDMSAEQQALLMSFIGTAAAAFIRTQVTAPVTAEGARQA